MTRTQPLAAALAAVAALTACSNEVDTARTMVEIADDAAGQAEVFAEPVDVVTDRLYLGSPNLVSVTEEAPWHYGAFDLLEKSRVGIEVQTTDPSDWSWVGFKVYHVAADGTLELLGVLEGEGWAGAIMRTRRGGTFVVESVGETLPTSLQVDITCMRNDGRPCSPNVQPGGLCGTRGAGSCDTGLFCQMEGCGRDDRGGTCERPVEMCPAVYGPVVCGCDGREYGTACQALAAGVNVDFAGACPCDPLVFRTKVDGIVDVSGRWTGKAQSPGEVPEYDISSSLTLGADSTFTYEQVWDPVCLRTPPFCRRASLVFSMTGTWENQGFAVQLTPSTTDVPQELAQSFMIEENCEGHVELSTVELSQDRRLARDPCSRTTCAEGQHCEVVEVQCVRAPCYPVAQCVAD